MRHVQVNDNSNFFDSQYSNINTFVSMQVDIVKQDCDSPTYKHIVGLASKYTNQIKQFLKAIW